jgi:hypothetical protein
MHQQSARRAPSTATVPRSAQIAAILQVSPKTIGRAAVEQLAASPTQEVRAA